jgi:hypothetical protein
MSDGKILNDKKQKQLFEEIEELKKRNQKSTLQSKYDIEKERK